jgi:two-component system, chemotaxis family, protein-glutamate methylesterase/glutaminase
VGTAGDGEEAVSRTVELRPDVVVLDVQMPRVDGLEALRRIMSEAPTPVLMLSTVTRLGAKATIQALELGAVDFLDKSSGENGKDINSLATVLREKVMSTAGALVGRPSSIASHSTPIPSAPRQGNPGYEIVVVGASTGGPRALAELVGRLPADFPAPVVVAQHMPGGFTRLLAERLDRHCALKVIEAEHDQALETGCVYIAPGGNQLTLSRPDGRLRFQVDGAPSSAIYRPSIDLLLRSAIEHAGSRTIGVILTGMGNDGARGLRALRRAGGRTLAESRDTAVIYGMPRAAAPAAEQVLPVGDIAPVLIDLVLG